MNKVTAEFGPVAPIQILEGLYNYGPQMFGAYHLLLAHHTIEKEEEFRALFKRIDQEKHFGDGELTIIMDNSIVELGDAVSAATVAHAVSIIEDSCECARIYPVLPDVMGDGEATRIAIRDSYDQWTRIVGGHGFMAVCQGETLDDFRETLELVTSSEYPEITWVGVPRILVPQIGSRWQATHDAIATDKCVHLLGFSDDMEDDFACARLEGVSGIDSAVPLRCPDVFTPYITTEKRDPNWFNDAVVTPHMISNLTEARRYIGVSV